MTARKCGHRSFNVIGKDGAFKVRCSTCGLTGATPRKTIEEAYRRRREDWEAAAPKEPRDAA